MINNDNIVFPFKAVRPIKDYAGKVIAPPYDVLDAKEAKEKVRCNPYSFLHISKAEIDLKDDISPYDTEVYKKAAQNFNDLIKKGILIKENKPCYYIYRIIYNFKVITGIALGASCKAYDENKIKKHELTRVEKEEDRVKQIKAVRAQTGLVMLIYPDIKKIEEMLDKIILNTQPEYDVFGENNTKHQIWVIKEEEDINLITQEFNRLGKFYIADGHHRSAAASRIAKDEPLNQAAGKMLAVAFPSSQMQIMDYNRVVKDLNGLSESEFIKKLEQEFTLTKKDSAYKPQQSKEFSMYLNDKWYKLSLKEPFYSKIATENLDVSILTEKILNPILNVGDLRKSNRINFIGGIRGLGELEKLVDTKEYKVAFALYPTTVQNLIDVAEAGEIMPPKSTWFEPKLADGLLSNPID